MRSKGNIRKPLLQALSQQNEADDELHRLADSVDCSCFHGCVLRDYQKPENTV